MGEAYYYDDRLWGKLFWRIDPMPHDWKGFRALPGGWRVANLPWGVRFCVNEAGAELYGHGVPGMESYGAKASFPARETTMSMVRLGYLWWWPAPERWRVEFLALSLSLPEGSVHTLAVRPADGGFERMIQALKAAGVSGE